MYVDISPPFYISCILISDVCVSNMRYLILAVVHLAMSMTGVAGKFGPDDNICSISEYIQTAKVRPPQKKPQLPKQWSVRIEVDMFDEGYSMDVHEYYDSVNNRGAVSKWKKGLETRMIYLYDTREVIVLQYDGSGSPPKCHIEALANNTQDDYFGLRQYANGTEHIYDPANALHFEGEGTEVPMGRTEGPDGTEVDTWESCTYIEALDATLVIDWLFSANTDWISPDNMVVPIQRSAAGVMHVNQTYTKQIDRRYLYTDFRLLDDNLEPFQTPPGTFCENRTSVRPLPAVPKTLSYSTEIIKPLKKHVSWMREYYNYNLNLTRYDYRPDPDSGSPYGYNMLTRVDDFNSGVSYVIDEDLGNCSVTTIDALGFDAKSVGPHSARMRNTKEFFYLDNSKYEYAGQRIVRDINCDVFIGIRNDYPPGLSNTQSTWEWYFASREWNESVGASVNSGIPVRLQITATDPVMNYIYNIYDYSEDMPDIWKTDVSSCFIANQKYDFKLTFPVTNVDGVTSDINGFKIAVMRAINTVTNVSPIRINRMEVEFPAGNVTVVATLLDTPPITGESPVQKSMTTLAEAVSALTNAAQQGYLAVALPDGKGVLTAISIA